MSPAERARYVVTLDRMDMKCGRPRLSATAIMDHTSHAQTRVLHMLNRMISTLKWSPVLRFGDPDARLRYRYRWT